jgi:transposase
VIGVDLGDRVSHLAVMEASGELVEETQLRTTSDGLQGYFSRLAPARVVLEVGTHSPWVSRLVGSLGHEVLVLNAHRVKLIAASMGKTDRVDARILAELGRLGTRSLRPVVHRSEQAQLDMTVLRSRAAAVRARTLLVNHVRGAAKAHGVAIGRCDVVSLPRKAAQALPREVLSVLAPLLGSIASLSRQIREMDRAVALLIAERYAAEVACLRQVKGVGPITALTYVLTIQDPARFQTSRQVGHYLGLTPGVRQSGDRSRQLGIRKAGDSDCRWLLVQCAHYILGHASADSDLRRWGERKAAGGKAARKRAVVAMARKLAVLLHRLWVSGATYQRFRMQQEVQAA